MNSLRYFGGEKSAISSLIFQLYSGQDGKGNESDSGAKYFPRALNGALKTPSTLASHLHL